MELIQTLNSERVSDTYKYHNRHTFQNTFRIPGPGVTPSHPRKGLIGWVGLSGWMDECHTFTAVLANNH